MGAKKWLLLGSVVGALIIVGCGEPKSGVSKENKEYRKETKDAPKWVVGELSKVNMHDKQYSDLFLARGSYEIVSGDVSFATDQATAAARTKLAANLKSTLLGEIKSAKTRMGQDLDKQASTKVDQAVERELVATKQVAEWVGKDRVWVLVGLDQGIVSKIRSELGLQSK
ncbi:LPP20 family lipoprotein [Helicobacter ailurogastricus]|uniref:LPP20 family lipoprotein n=1 Tax=Helicobacter ailurogastricus TaxID=1578720 RepID=UPI000CF0A09A|nr:LPP20 family lipoprotein [Helicobacter ailurogastricus]GMB91084.1 LPP20 lipoprotein [Helicobacter ailurogastricus]